MYLLFLWYVGGELGVLCGFGIGLCVGLWVVGVGGVGCEVFVDGYVGSYCVVVGYGGGGVV